MHRTVWKVYLLIGCLAAATPAIGLEPLATEQLVRRLNLRGGLAVVLGTANMPTARRIADEGFIVHVLDAMISVQGRLLYVMDNGSRLSPVLPERWTLFCRDAFNGILAWKRALPSWHTHWWPVKSGPTQAMRRLAAAADRIDLPLGVGAPLSELDVATGKTLRTFPQTAGIEEVRISDNTLFLLTSDTVARQQEFNLTNVEV